MMLWDALAQTLTTFTNWEVYLAGAIYFVVTLGPYLLAAVNGGWLVFVVQPFFQALGVLIFVTLVAPIALGLSADAPWHLPWQFITDAPSEVVKDTFLLVLISVVVAFVPVLGGLPSFNSLILGVFATKMVFDLAGVEGISRADMLPDFAVAVGILLLGAAVSFVGTLIAMILSGLLGIVVGQDAEELTPLIALPIVAILGFAPLLVYMSWLGMTLG